jgi:hypothetical protein
MATPPPLSPQALKYNDARVHASQHRVEIEASERCGCFSCFRIFPNADIKSWVDKQQTALCPHCGLDTVLGSAYCQIGDQFLRRLNQHQFPVRSK